MYRRKKYGIKATHTICSLGYWRSRRTSPVLVHEGTFSLCDTLKKTAEYKCPRYSYTANSNMTALTRNASQTFLTNIHVTFTSPIHIRKATTGTESQTVFKVFFLQNICLSWYVCNYKTRFLNRDHVFFLGGVTPKAKYLEKKNIKTECDCNWIQFLLWQVVEVFCIP